MERDQLRRTNEFTVVLHRLEEPALCLRPIGRHEGVRVEVVPPHSMRAARSIELLGGKIVVGRCCPLGRGTLFGDADGAGSKSATGIHETENAMLTLSTRQAPGRLAGEASR